MADLNINTAQTIGTINVPGQADYVLADNNTAQPITQVVEVVVSELDMALNALGVAGNAVASETPDVSPTTAPNNTNANIAQKTDASQTIPPTGAGVTAGTPISNANMNTVHVCDVCGSIGMGIAQARMEIMQALKALRQEVLDALGLGDAEAQAKALKAQVAMFKKAIKAVQDFIQTVENYLKMLETLIKVLENYITALIKSGLKELVSQFQQCLSDAKASYAAGVAQQKSAMSSQ